MTAEFVCLTLIAARSLRDELFDYLSEQRDLVSGFTASDAAGHGPDVRLQTSGRAGQRSCRRGHGADSSSSARCRAAARAAEDGIRRIEACLLDHAGHGIWRDRRQTLILVHPRRWSSLPQRKSVAVDSSIAGDRT